MKRIGKAGRPRLRGAVTRLIVVVGVIGAVGWSWLHLWDHYHPAAPAGRRLWTGEPAERIAAIGDLGRVGRDDIDVAIPALVESLGDRDATVRAAAASAFVSVVPGTRGEKPRREHIGKAASALVENLKDPQPPVRAAAAEAVWMVMSVGQVPAGEPVLDQVRTALIERLGDPDASVRLAAIRGLGSVGPKVADEPPAPLLAVLEDEAEKNRDAAAFALASFHRGLPPVAAVLGPIAGWRSRTIPRGALEDPRTCASAAVHARGFSRLGRGP